MSDKPTTTTTALAVRDNAQMAITPTSMEGLLDMSRLLAKSSLLPAALRGKPDDVAVVLMTGMELGMSPMQALRGINVINGKGVMDATNIVGRVMASPVCEYFVMVESTDLIATYETKRKGAPKPTTLSYSIQQAKVAGLLDKNPTYRSHPAAMLRARASSSLARVAYPDVVSGFHAPEEMDEVLAPEQPRDVTPAKSERPAFVTQQVQAPVAAPVVVPPPALAPRVVVPVVEGPPPVVEQVPTPDPDDGNDAREPPLYAPADAPVQDEAPSMSAMLVAEAQACADEKAYKALRTKVVAAKAMMDAADYKPVQDAMIAAKGRLGVR